MWREESLECGRHHQAAACLARPAAAPPAQSRLPPRMLGSINPIPPLSGQIHFEIWTSRFGNLGNIVCNLSHCVQFFLAYLCFFLSSGVIASVFSLAIVDCDLINLLSSTVRSMLTDMPLKCSPFLLLYLLYISECRFSDKRYELEETWHPDLGPPFGVMYCVHCECVAVSLDILVW